MGVAIFKSTIQGCVTPACSSCGVVFGFDIDLYDYQLNKNFWENCECEDCKPLQEKTYSKLKKGIEMAENIYQENTYMEKISGVVEKIIFKNEENGFHVLNVWIKGKNKDCIVTVNQLKIHEGITMEFEGQWISNQKYGKQFKAEKSKEVEPETKEAIVRYLSSTFFKGIGPVIAKNIVDHFGEKTLEILKTNIDKLIEVNGVSKKKLEKIRVSWIENTEINEIMIFLQGYNISTLFATRIYETYGRDCINQIRQNPYRLSNDIYGIGFKYADKIALDIGIARDSKERLAAGINYVLLESEKDGHCYLLYSQILKKCEEILEAKVHEKIQDVLNALVEENMVKILEKDSEKRYYSNQLFYDEIYCANKIKILKNQKIQVDNSLINEWIETTKKEDIQLSDSQVLSINQTIQNGVSVLTGGPGCGKTTTLKYFIKLLEKLNLSYLLVAPTGRAAQRMSEVTGASAQTIHRLLGWDFVTGEFIHNEKNEIFCEFLIVDETSMVDIRLASALLKAVPKKCQILFIGDIDQLPPVGPGLFFKDLIDSKCVNTYVLNEIFRQQDGSDIIECAHQINKGIDPNIKTPLISPEMWPNKSGCMFIDSELRDANKIYKDYPDWSTLYYGLDIIQMIQKIYVETIKKYYGEKMEVQVLCPMNIGDVGTIKINESLQEAVNPASNKKMEIKIRNIILRDGDRVIQTSNNYDLGVFNGDIGKIITINPEEKECVIEFGSENKKVIYKRDQLLELNLAYCITIHKSQGSEFDATIIPLTSQHHMMLYRNLVYTGLTRSKKLCVFIGQRSSFLKSIQNVKQIKRQTSLIEFLKS